MGDGRSSRTLHRTLEYKSHLKVILSNKIHKNSKKKSESICEHSPYLPQEARQGSRGSSNDSQLVCNGNLGCVEAVSSGGQGGGTRSPRD